MADLTKQDRIDLSSKLIAVPGEIAAANEASDAIEAAKVVALATDATNKKLVDERTTLIDGYQEEAKYLDGITRTEFSEQLIDDSARRVAGNTFYPANPQQPLPTLPDGLWKALSPLARTHTIGKTNLEVYSATGGRTEFDIISDLNAKIIQIEASPIPNNATGQKCTLTGSCSGEDNPVQTTESGCLADNGSWTPGPDTYVEDTSVTALLSQLETLIQEWEDVMVTQQSSIPTNDANATRAAGNTVSLTSIVNTKVIIDNWQLVQDFDTNTALPPGTGGTGCAIFDAMIEGQFEQAKLQPTTLLPVKQAITARTNSISVRASELIGINFLGTVVQTDDGTMTTKTGLYGERALLLNIRIGLLGGSLSEVVSLENAVEIQAKTIQAAEDKQEAYNLILVASLLTAPALDTFYLNLSDSSSFSAGDRVYVTADEQEELSGSIEEISGNRVKLTFKVPKKFTVDNNTRMYKTL